MKRLYDRICCSFVRLWLVPRAEGAVVPLPLVVLHWISHHLDYCKRCHIELKGLRLTTYTLQKAGKSHVKTTFDEGFAERVINRVKREEALRKRQRRHLQTVLASGSAFACFTVAFGFLGGFNILRAAFFPNRDAGLVVPHQTILASPFSEHDPFAKSDAAAAKSDLLSNNYSFKFSESPLRSSGKSNPPIPDYLSKLIADRPTPALTYPSSTAKPIVLPPVLAASSVNAQSSKTQPELLASKSAPNDASIAAPPQSAPTIAAPPASFVSAAKVTTLTASPAVVSVQTETSSPDSTGSSASSNLSMTGDNASDSQHQK